MAEVLVFPDRSIQTVGSCDGCGRPVLVSDLSTQMVCGAEGEFCGRCILGDHYEEEA